MGSNSHNVRPISDRPAGFSRLLEAQQGPLYAYILALVFNRADADDVLQQTNVVLWRKAGEFEPGTNFRAWAMRVAAYEVMRHRRNMARDRLVFDEQLLESLEAEAAIADVWYDARVMQLERCMSSLSQADQRLVRDRYVKGSSVQQMAEDLGRTPNAVSQALFRVRSKLMACVKRQKGEAGGPAGRH